MEIAKFWILTMLSIHLISCKSGNGQDRAYQTDWVVSDLLETKKDITVLGEPKKISSPFGEALYFDGIDDGILIDEMPLKDLSEYAIEMVIRFDGGNYEQRYFHTGTMQKDRSLLEMRSNADSWYLDGMFESKEKWVVLMDSTYVHPLREWHHIAFSVKDGEQATYVNGHKELEGSVEFSPISDGATSIGMRQNRVSWFKGAIYCIRITNRALGPDQFLIHENKFKSLP